MKLSKILLISLGFFFLQILMGKFLPSAMPIPNLILCFVIVGAFVEDDPWAWVLAAGLFGLIRDLFISMNVGLGTGALIAAVASMLLLKKFINSEHMLSSIVCAIVGSFVYIFTFWLLSKAVMGAYGISDVMKFFVLQVWMHIVLAFGIYYFLSRNRIIQRRNDRYRYYR
ncbi:MAG: hypothetical protein PUK21_04675 [Peptostreptococcaceae bacterium]|nr:hypothetical protein [Peptostreptococcaceae bacterium]MDY5738813.1 hypothetical protein [Anaerovoracaceae bacterium]